MKNPQTRRRSVLLYISFIIYILVLAFIVFFKTPLALLSPDRPFSRSLNLVLFDEISRYLQSPNIPPMLAAMNLLGNIVIFIPLGIYLQTFLRRKNLLLSLILCALTSAAIEGAQYIFGLGATDVDDLLLNTLGGLFGILLYRIFARHRVR